ncbi:MAG: phosphoenolpyruvate carboxykinase [Dehalococcoidia bacterium]|jgi:phosphoenolpyruvate carboxykinase (ATP)
MARNAFKEAPLRIYEDAKRSGRLIENFDLGQAKALALTQDGIIETQLGSVAASSEPMSRAAQHTKNSVDHAFGDDEEALAAKAVQAMSSEKILSLDVWVGDGDDGVSARFLMPLAHADVAYGLKLLFNHPSMVVEEPTYTVIFFTDEAFEANKSRRLAEKDIEVRLFMGEKRGEQVKICRNTAYMGEGKKGVFQFESWRVKSIDKTGVFLHAGARRDRIWVFDFQTERPELVDIVTAIGGATATGKTTSLCRRLARMPKESSEMIGEDGGTFGFDGSYAAFELGGLYVKTEGLDASQPEILRAAESKDTFLENVAISKYPYIPNFADLSVTSNGRAVIARSNLEIASQTLRAGRVDNLMFLTRNPLTNVLSRLTPEQMTMQLIYGESIESSGGNPEEAGTFKREFFLDPFVTGNRLEHAMIFYDMAKRNNIKCYLANTGTIGEDETKVDLRQSLSAYNDMLRNVMIFSSEPDHLGYHFPVRCDRANLDYMRAAPLFPDRALLSKKVEDFLRGRREYLERFESEYGQVPANIKDSLPH